MFTCYHFFWTQLHCKKYDKICRPDSEVQQLRIQTNYSSVFFKAPILNSFPSKFRACWDTVSSIIKKNPACLSSVVAVYRKQKVVKKTEMRWFRFLLSARLISSSKVRTERCKRGLLSVSRRNQSGGFRRHCSRFTTRLLASLLLLPLLFVSHSGVAHKHGMSQHDFNCQRDCGHFSGRWVLMACYGNERKEQRPFTEQWA